MNLDTEEGEAVMSQVRRLMIGFLEKHEAETHGGAACWGNRISALANLCHALAVRGPEMMQALAREIGEYDRRCEDRQCRHRLN